jgi:hypothetical protein
VRVLNVISSVDPSGGGTTEALKQLGQVLLHQGHIVEVACLDAPDSSWLKTFPLKTHALGPGISGYRYSKHLGLGYVELPQTMMLLSSMVFGNIPALVSG